MFIVYLKKKGLSDFYVERTGYYVAAHNNSQLPVTKYEGVSVPVGMESGKFEFSKKIVICKICEKNDLI
jgi:hypothetical protein